MKTRKALLVLSFAVLGPFSCGSIALGQPSSPPPGMVPTPKVVQADKHDVSPALRDIPALPPTARPKALDRRLLRVPPSRVPRGPAVLDPVLQSALGVTSAPATGANFEGIANADQASSIGWILPPDTNGAIGPNHYVQIVNVVFAIFRRDGARIYGPAAINTLWQGFGAACGSSNDGDPTVLYDHLADRWFISQLAIPYFPNGPFYQCIAVSTTGDPLGSYYRYEYVISDTKLNDYPKFGVWPDGYYLSVNQFDNCVDNFPFGITCDWAGPRAVVFERSQILAGQPARMVAFEKSPANLGGLLPSSLDGPAPPAGTPNYFVQVDDGAWFNPPVSDRLQIWAFQVDWSVDPPPATFGPSEASNPDVSAVALATAPFDSNMCDYQPNCIPQPGTDIFGFPSPPVDALSDRLMHRLQYRSFPTHDAIVTTHTVDTTGGDHAGLRWYELRKDAAGAWTIHQQGTYAPGDGDHRWMASIAMDQAGNIALGFSASSATTWPSIRYVTRDAGDPLGEMGQEASIVAGSGAQLDSSGRWGDYSAMSVDPTDECTFWYTQEYYRELEYFYGRNWRTRIASFRLPSCGVAASGADLSISKADTPDPVNAGATLTYTLNVTNAGPETATDVSVTDTLPVGVTDVSASGVGWTCSGTGPVTCTIGSLPVGAALPITITVTAPAAGGTISNTATVSSATADPNPNNNTATVTTLVQVAPSGSVTVLSPNGGETWQSPSNKVIQWTSSGVIGNMEIALSRDGGGTWEILFANTPNDGSERWRVTRPAATGARIRVRNVNDPRIEDSSDGNFTIR